MTSEFPPQPGGIGNHCYNLALQLSEHGYEVRVLADQRSDDGLEERDFDASLRFQVQRTALTSPRFLMYFKRLYCLFAIVRNSKRVIATGKFSLWSVAFCSLFYKRNYIAIVHGTEVNFKTFLLRRSIQLALKQFNIIIAVSNYTASLISNLNKPVMVIPNGIDLQEWQLPTASSHVELEGSPILITVGNVTSRKGQQHVIGHLPELMKVFPELHYHCIGLKTEADVFMTLADSLKVGSHVTFHGRVNEADLQATLIAADIFVMLSSETKTGDVEGFGIALLEANALGIPAIGAMGCGIEDAIDDGHSGLLIDAFDSDAFVNAIQTIISNRDRFEAGSKSWAQNHQWSDIIHLYIPFLT